MTREEAKQVFLSRGYVEVEGGTVYDADKWREACRVISEWLEQEPNTWSLDDAREDFMHDVYDTLDFLPTNNEANRIIKIFDRVTSGIKQESVLDKIRAEIEQITDTMGVSYNQYVSKIDVLQIIDKYRNEVS